ncbi:MAG: hypothetical protein ACP5OJ_02155 [Methanothermobacter sp.]
MDPNELNNRKVVNLCGTDKNHIQILNLIIEDVKKNHLIWINTQE